MKTAASEPSKDITTPILGINRANIKVAKNHRLVMEIRRLTSLT